MPTQQGQAVFQEGQGHFQHKFSKKKDYKQVICENQEDFIDFYRFLEKTIHM